ncbi:MAG: NAD(P)/FAD-dependent oxidoreductase [Orrella sp.]
MFSTDVVIVGAGAAGMMCAATAGQRGQRVVLIDHASKLAEKIRISGGGRCNFTNREVSAENFISGNPHFCKAALSAYTPQDFIDWVDSHGIAWHEKHRGQLFCDQSSEQIIAMLKSACDEAGVQWRMPCEVQEISKNNHGFVLQTSSGPIQTTRLVIASGGTSVPQVGATDFGLRVARQFGLKVVDPRPALVPLKFDPQIWQSFSQLAGLSVKARVSVADNAQASTFDEDILFTHRGLSGPGILQISSYWQPGQSLSIDLMPGVAVADTLITQKAGAKQQLGSVLAEFWPKRLAEHWLAESGKRKLAEWSDKALRELASRVQDWRAQPIGTEGFKKAEVMRGGVDTAELSQRSLESKRVPGLHFVGEVVDVTGWLGGYNFQWAWSSGFVSGRSIAESST